MEWSSLLSNAVKNLKQNSPGILTVLGITGLVGTAYLAGKAGYETAKKLEDTDPNMLNQDKVKLVWKLYIPPVASGVVSLACIVGASKSHANRTAAAAAAYSITEKAFSEYKGKVVEQIGKTKEQKIRDEIRQDQVISSKVGKEIIILGKGHVLCCELYTGRYFRSDMELLKRAENVLNQRIVNDLYVTMDEWYDIVGLSSTSHACDIGWNSDRLVELEFSSVFSEDGEPCLAFDYSYVKPIKL